MTTHLVFWVEGEIRTPLHKSWSFLFSKWWHWSILHSFRRRNNKDKTRWSTSKLSATVNKHFWNQFEKCPVKFFVKYILKHPLGMEKSGPFYLQPMVNILTNIWYKKTPMGINNINSSMKNLISNSPLQNIGKHILQEKTILQEKHL